MLMAAPVLQEIRQRCQPLKDEQRPLVVFDLDATLFDYTPRTLRIIHEFVQKHQIPLIEDISSVLESLEGQKEHHRFLEILDLCGARDEQMHRKATEFWFERFFSDTYQMYDIPIKGASEFVRAVFEIPATVVYLSGRNVPQMVVGCTDSLRKHGFPIGYAGSMLMLKPHMNMHDLQFKNEVLDFIDSLGVVVASFDNEPENCNLFQKRWPEAIVVHLDTQNKKSKSLLHKDVISIPHFE